MGLFGTEIPTAGAVVAFEPGVDGKARFDIAYDTASARHPAAGTGRAVRGRWGIENHPGGLLDIAFNDDPSAGERASPSRMWPQAGAAARGAQAP